MDADDERKRNYNFASGDDSHNSHVQNENINKAIFTFTGMETDEGHLPSEAGVDVEGGEPPRKKA